MEVIKSYKILIDALTDLIEFYFKLKEIVLETIFKHLKRSRNRKAHLRLTAEERRKLRSELLKRMEIF